MNAPSLVWTVFLAAVLTGCARDAAEIPAEPRVPEDRSERIEVAGTELFVRQVGDGPPLIVVHGGPVLDHGYLYEPLLPLAAEHELVFYDQRLSGRSSGTTPEGSMSIARMVDDIEAVRVSRGLERVDVLGHSWGGFLAALYAARHPDRVRRLILVSPMAPTSDLRFEEEMAARGRMDESDAAAMEEVRASDAFQQQTPEGIAAMLRASFRSQFADPALASRLEFEIPADYVDRSARWGALFPELQSYDLSDELAGIRAPTLLVYGDAEVGAGYGGPAWEAAIPGASLETIPGAGHFPFLEEPHAFMDRIDLFLDAGR